MVTLKLFERMLGVKDKGETTATGRMDLTVIIQIIEVRDKGDTMIMKMEEPVPVMIMHDEKIRTGAI